MTAELDEHLGLATDRRDSDAALQPPVAARNESLALRPRIRGVTGSILRCVVEAANPFREPVLDGREVSRHESVQ